VDRARELTERLPEKPVEEPQIRLLYRRARILQQAILFAVASVLLTSFLAILQFALFLMGIHRVFTAIALFSASLFCLIVSLILFLADMSLSLKALKLELKDHRIF